MENSSLTAINNAYHGIRWEHISSGLDSPTDYNFVKLAFEGAKRLANKEKNQKEPITSEILLEIINKFGFNSYDLLLYVYWDLQDFLGSVNYLK